MPAHLPSPRPPDGTGASRHQTFDFAHQVRDALHHLDDPVYLQRHALTRQFMQGQDSRAASAGRRLRQSLLEAIEALRPDASASAGSPSWRSYAVLHHRYVKGLEITDVQGELAIGRTEYHAAQRRGLEALTSLLEERWGQRDEPRVHERADPSEPEPSMALPMYLTSFIGREPEVTAVVSLLSRSRLVTLTGPGGIGKTRLALHVATQLQDSFADGIACVHLAQLVDPGLVLPTIVRALGIREAAVRTVLELLTEYLRDRRFLLVLDNFEQVVTAAPQIGALLTACPKLKVLVTSPASLHLSGEQEFAVPSLDLPDRHEVTTVERLSQYDAVRLFSDRAADARHDFALTSHNAAAVAEICHRLDGLPLALELAAARTKVLPPQALLTRLQRRLSLLTGGPRDRPPRQQTLRATIDWSYNLLDIAEQTLFCRLSVFLGGSTLEAAEAVCADADDPDRDVLNDIGSLVDKSLLRHEEVGGEPRIGMLETMREYGWEQLQQRGEADAIQQRHAAYYLALAEQGDTPYLAFLKGGEVAEQRVWLDRFAAEHDNLRAALAYFLAKKHARDSLRLAGALTEFWDLRIYWTEGRSWLERALALPGATEHPHLRARALLGAGTLAIFPGDYPAARVLLEESVACWRSVGGQHGLAVALARLGSVMYMPRSPTARPLFEESLALFRALDHQQGIAEVLRSLGFVTTDAGDYATAHALLTESMTIWQQRGDRRGAATAIEVLGYLARAQGNNATARTHYERSLTMYRAQGAKRGIVTALYNLGTLADREGDSTHAIALCEEALVLAREIRDKDGTAATLERLGRAVRHHGEEHGAAELFRESLQLRAAARHTMGTVICLCELAESALLARYFVRAAHVFAAAQRLRDTSTIPPGVFLLYYDQHVVDRHVATLRTALGEAAFAAAWTAGHAMTLEHAIAEALEMEHSNDVNAKG